MAGLQDLWDGFAGAPFVDVLSFEPTLPLAGSSALKSLTVPGTHAAKP